MTTRHTVVLEYPRAIFVQGGSLWRKIVGIGDSPCVPKVNLTVSLTTRERGVELSIAQANELIRALTEAVLEAEQTTESSNQYFGQKLREGRSD